MSKETPEQVLEAVVDGINTGNFETLMDLMSLGLLSRLNPEALLTGWGISAKRWVASFA